MKRKKGINYYKHFILAILFSMSVVDIFCQKRNIVDTIQVELTYNHKKIEDISLFTFTLIIKDSLDSIMDSLVLQGNKSVLLAPITIFEKKYQFKNQIMDSICLKKGDEFLVSTAEKINQIYQKQKCDFIICINEKRYIISDYPYCAIEPEKWIIIIEDLKKKEWKKYNGDYQYFFSASGLGMAGTGWLVVSNCLLF